MVSAQSSLTVTSGSATTSTVNLTSLNGFAGTVNLAPSASPSGLTVSLSPTSMPLTSGGTGTSTLTVSSSTVGTYTVTITGTSGSLSHQVIITVSVVASSGFTIAANPSTVGFQSGSNASSTINLTSLGNFSGNVNLTESVTPSTGLTVSCNPTIVLLSSGSSANSTCTLIYSFSHDHCQCSRLYSRCEPIVSKPSCRYQRDRYHQRGQYGRVHRPSISLCSLHAQRTSAQLELQHRLAEFRRVGNIHANCSHTTQDPTWHVYDHDNRGER